MNYHPDFDAHERAIERQEKTEEKKKTEKKEIDDQYVSNWRMILNQKDHQDHHSKQKSQYKSNWQMILNEKHDKETVDSYSSDWEIILSERSE